MIMKIRFAVTLMILATAAGAVSGQEATETESRHEEAAAEARPVEKPDYAAWRGEIRETRQRLNAFNLLTRLSTSGGAKVTIPAEMQRLPLEDMEDTKALAEKGIEVYLRDLRFYNVVLDNPGETQWEKNHPYLPTMIRFDRVQASAEAKTKFGNFPLKSQFLKGILPVNFDILREGYEVNVMPDPRKEEGSIGDVKVESKIPFASGILTKLLGPKLQQGLLEFGVGQTLKLNMDGGTDLESLVRKGIFNVLSGELEKNEDGKGDKLQGLLDGLLK